MKTNNKNLEILSGKQPFKVIETNDEWVLYHNEFSLCSRKVRICMSEADIHYKSKHINIIETGNAENLSKYFKKINPKVTVPVLLHNGYPIYESHEQIKYLNEHKNDKLIINDDENSWIRKASLVGEPINNLDQYAGNCVSLLTPPLFISMLRNISIIKFFPYMIKHPIKFRAVNFLFFKLLGYFLYRKSTPLYRISLRASRNLNQHLKDLDAQINDKEWIMGNDFSLADISWAVILHRLEELQLLDHILHTYSNIESYYERLKKRKCFIDGIVNFQNKEVDTGVMRLKKSIQDVKNLSFMYHEINKNFTR